MDANERLSLELDYWDNSVGTFEPTKVLRMLQATFQNVEIDPTDHQRTRLLRELEFWATTSGGEEQRETLIRQSWGLYQTNGPLYRFVIALPSGQQVNGSVRRMSVIFQVPRNLPSSEREELVLFLRSLRLGEPLLTTEDEESDA